MKYFVCELNNKLDGTPYLSVYRKDYEKQALKVFHQKCATLIDSTDYTSALVQVVREDGYIVESKAFSYEA